jgi:Phosphoesterase family
VPASPGTAPRRLSRPAHLAVPPGGAGGHAQLSDDGNRRRMLGMNMCDERTPRHAREATRPAADSARGAPRASPDAHPCTAEDSRRRAARPSRPGGASKDYIPHHEPFQYFPSTANPQHLAPTSISKIGRTDQANHQYDLADFWAGADTGNLPAVSFLKAAAYQDGHAGYSDPLDEQHFLVQTINRLEKLPNWKSTAVVIAYDDSDGWYDHQMGPIVSHSSDPANDALAGAGRAALRLPVPTRTGAAMGRGCRCWWSRPTPSRTMSTAQ